MSEARKYELVYILTPDVTEEQVAAVQEQIESTVQRLGGTLEKTENWGRRKLAYEIDHHKEGVYVLHVILGGGELMKELDRRLKVIDYVIRQLAVRVDEEEEVLHRRQAARREQQQQRRIARGLPPEEEAPAAAPAPAAGERASDDQREEAEV